MEEIQVIFVLYGDICTIPEIVDRIKDSGKKALVHIDLISRTQYERNFRGVYQTADKSRRDHHNQTGVGAAGKRLGLFTVLRFFVIDSLALKNIENLESQRGMSRPDFIEVLPGVMPKVLRKIAKVSRIPMIAGGLVTDREDVIQALSAGAVAVSTTNREVWTL